MKKRVMSVLLAGIMCLSMTACSSGVSQADHQQVLDEKAKLESQVKDLESQLEEANEKLKATPEPTATPKPTPTPEPTPTPTPTPEPTATPDPAVAAQEFKDTCVGDYSYKELARDPATYVGKPAKFTGKVIQVMEDSGITVLRVNVTEGDYGIWEDTLYVTYFPGEGEKRILEDDIVTLYGNMTDLVTYETVMGSSVSIPGLLALYIDFAE